MYDGNFDERHQPDIADVMYVRKYWRRRKANVGGIWDGIFWVSDYTWRLTVRNPFGHHAYFLSGGKPVHSRYYCLIKRKTAWKGWRPLGTNRRRKGW